MSNIDVYANVKAYGIELPGFKAFIPKDRVGRQRLAMDSLAPGAVTYSNSGIPAELTTYYDSNIIDILTQEWGARKLLGEARPGGLDDGVHDFIKFRVNEFSGYTVPYTDFGSHGETNTNYEWLAREQYKYQTFIYYGSEEIQKSAAAKIDLIADKQSAAAHVLDTQTNSIYLYGVEGREIYGFLNDPNLPGAIQPIDVSGGGAAVIKWSAKTAIQIFNDIIELFTQLVSQSRGLIDQSTPLTLATSHEIAPQLAKTTEFNITVQEMLNKYFSSLTIVSIPELKGSGTGGVEQIYLYAPNVRGQVTGEFIYGEKFKAFPIKIDHSSFSQKVSGSSFGCLIRYPWAYAHMVEV
jgi:hypothetical protein